jgi:hypothetical protein
VEALWLLAAGSQCALNFLPELVHDDPVTVKHATASVFVFCRLAQGWRLGLIKHPIQPAPNPA